MSNTDFVKNFIAGGVGGVCTVAPATRSTRSRFASKRCRSRSPDSSRSLPERSIALSKLSLRRDSLHCTRAWPPRSLASPLFAVYFGGCAIGRWLQQSHPGEELTTLQNFNAGALAGVFTTVMTAPGERIKCLLQAIHGQQLREVRRTHGRRPQAVEGGRNPQHLQRNRCYSPQRYPCQWSLSASYEYLKKKFAGDNKEKSLSPVATLIAGGLAGIANWSVCIPADVLSRLQTAPEGKYPDGIRGVLREILREDGLKALFKGFTPVMLRAFPANAACFLGFELTLNLFRKFS
ncbi:hypothetical protein L596_009321 [Steinernema carpocapsae]|uniref:Mitochondrial carrier protein n=1 Tax=Steinernema carpocapsae TaxID=34508 RepID=A0A4U5PF03_STECR|nr:hypothetical protein L596_009321 [Steinernema carpocapsae]